MVQTKKTKRYTDKQFEEAVRESISWAGVLKKLGLVAAGGNYSSAQGRAKKLHLGTDHFLGQGHLKGKTHNWGKKMSLKEALVKNSPYASSGHLRSRLIKEGIFEEECSECKLTEWRGKPITLELDHKNGDRRDNRKVNLRLLCPNCHSQTPTFRNKKR